MARILCVTNGLAGMLYSSLELARRLSAAGHEVTYCSFPEADSVVRAHHLPFLPLERDQARDFAAEDSKSNPLVRLRSLSQRRQRGIDALALDGFINDLQDLAPELLLIDGEMHEHIIAATGTCPRIALLNAFVSIHQRPGLPPPHHQVIPQQGWWGSRLGLRLLWAQLGLRKAHRRWSQALRALGCDRVSLLRGLAQNKGFDFDRDVDFDQWLMPFTYRSMPMLTLHAREFEFPHKAATNAHYVGPMVSSERGRQNANDAVQEALSSIVAKRQAEPDRKLIYAGFGSFFTADPTLLERLFLCLRSRPDWDLVLSLGGKSVEGFTNLPANVHAFSWLPQTQLLDSVDAAIVHGGTNTADECVLARVPMLVYCGHETDMAGTTARVQFHGIGVAGKRGTDSPLVIEHHLERLLTESAFAQNLERLRVSYLRYRDQQTAEQLVAKLLIQ